jgi:hypothetical protein
MRVDAEGKPTGSVFPAYQPLPVPQTMRDWQARGLATPTPPGSSNVYARWYVEKLFPLDDSCGDAPDSACLAEAVWFGDVVTVAKPLVFCRLHDRNDGRTPDPVGLPVRLHAARQRFSSADGLRGWGVPARRRICPIRSSCCNSVCRLLRCGQKSIRCERTIR